MRGWNSKAWEWRNVTENVACRPQHMYSPKSKLELIGAVKFAHEHNLPVRVAALGHSTSSLVPTTGVLIMTDNLQQIKVNEKKQTVWFESGVSIMQLEAELRKVGLCVPHSVLSREFFWVGCQSTNSHGSGIKYGGMNHFLIHADILDSEGIMRRYVKAGHKIEDEDTAAKNEAEGRPDIFHAVMSPLGMMGVIYAVTLQAEPIYKVKVTDIEIPFALDQGIPDDLRKLVYEKEAVEFNWFLGDKLWIHYTEPTKEELTMCACVSCCGCACASAFCGCCASDTKQGCLAVKDSWERLNEAFKTGAGQILLLPMLQHPHTTPLFTKFASASISAGTPSSPFQQVRWVPDAVHIMHLFYGTDIGVEFLEFGFQCDDDWNNVHQAWKVAVNKLREYNAKGKYPINALIQSRFTGRNDALLSPHNLKQEVEYATAYQKTPAKPTVICWIELVTFCKEGGASKDYEDYSKEVGQAWMKLSGHPHPHWAKRFKYIPGIIDHIHRVFRETNNGIERFLAIRDELNVDPHNRFVNPYLDDLFFAPRRSRHASVTEVEIKTTGPSTAS